MNGPSPARPPLSPLRRELRNFSASVVALHVVALVVYAAAGIRGRPQSVQTMFGGVWTVLTVLLVVRGLLRVRAARRA